MKQVEITKKTPLLDENGNVISPGYCKRNMYIYKRSEIKAHPMRIKEWDFYQIATPRYSIQVIIADISMGGAGILCVLDRQTGERCDCMKLSVLTNGKLGLSEDDDVEHENIVKGKNFELRAIVEKTRRILRVKCRNKADVDITLEMMPDLEYMTMAVPFKEDKHFYLNKKLNCMPASGHVKAGKIEFDLNPETDFCLLDWGRGVWPYNSGWTWGNGTARLENGKLFGFEIGWGFGDMSAASENMLFYDGKGHKIGYITLQRDEKDWMKPWVFKSDDGRFDMTMTPTYDNITNNRVICLGNICHQVFGMWNGTATLDDGTVLEIKDMVAFCEVSDNRW